MSHDDNTLDPFPEMFDAIVKRRHLSQGSHGKLHAPADAVLDSVPENDPLCSHEGHDGFSDEVEFQRKPAACYPPNFYPNCQQCEAVLSENGKLKYRDAEWLYEQYHEQKRSTREVAARAGVSDWTIRWWMDHHGIERRGAHEAERVKQL